jgi:hypothetical protein
MNAIRIVAILVGIAIVFSLEFVIGEPSYVAVPLGILGYLLARYAGSAINERRR